ncbi:type 11 methyltransferase [Calothrix parasitica NIES-267]|uniref:Type 11 methyltransferase n=1 Tax=Calothrix parasitica NIES-267 TaxID=1973488 RepID=A0A1Z4LR97_9CYAN|nr:type 11 methyltransferase [Calothrix parasitica NIES-267]
MGFYSRHIFPYLLDWSLSDSTFNQYRQEVLAEVEGEILEIGFGTGLNLSFYPDEINKIITVDNNPGVHKLAQKRIEISSITVDHRILSGENLPMSDNNFDSVVSTWTLCSIEKVKQAVKEIHRVLKPGGKFFFIEHGLSNESSIQTWQNRLNPIQNVIADGCNLNRNIRSIVQQQFSHIDIEEFYADKTPKFMGYMYKGVAVK